MKRLVLLFLSLALCVMLFASCNGMDKDMDSSQGDNGTANKEEEDYSKGLSFTLDGDKYAVSGIGTCKDSVIKIPSTHNKKPVAYIYGFAFEKCENITSVTIPDSVETICEYAFRGCKNLSSISIGDGVTSIGENSFYDTAYYEDESNWENGVLYIGKYLIKANSTLSGSYVVKEGTLCVAASAFSLCTKLTSVVIPNGVKGIGNEVFDECRALESVTIGEGVKSIGKSAFNGCRGLTSIVIPNGVESIGEMAFDDCWNLSSITLADSITSIGNIAFKETAYYGKESNWENGVLYIGKHLIEADDELSGEYAVKDGTLCIADLAFRKCENLTSLIFPKSVKSVGKLSVYGCTALTSITVEKENPFYHSAGNCLIETKSKTIILGCKNSAIPVNNSVNSIGDYAFYGCINLENVLIPNNIRSIGEYAFAGCEKLMSFIGANEVENIGSYAFYCTSLVAVSLPKSVTNIGYFAFAGCNNLASVAVERGSAVYHSAGNCIIETTSKTLVVGCNNSVIPTDGSVTSIGKCAFYGCTSLTNIIIPDSVTSIGTRAFMWCESLSNITIPDSVTSIGISAFYYCTSLTSITFEGTKAQWENMDKAYDWNKNTPTITVHCTDGDIVID